MLEGNCLCGGVRYEISGKLSPAVHCHCTQYRKASGASFATNASAAKDDFRFTSGEALLRAFESFPGQLRCFCSGCGSPLAKRNAARPDEIRLGLGTLDTDPKFDAFAWAKKGRWLVGSNEVRQILSSSA